MALPGAAEDKGTCKARVVDDLSSATVQQLAPDELTFVRAAA